MSHSQSSVEIKELFTEYQGHVSNIGLACLSQSSGFKGPDFALRRELVNRGRNLSYFKKAQVLPFLGSGFSSWNLLVNRRKGFMVGTKLCNYKRSSSALGLMRRASLSQECIQSLLRLSSVLHLVQTRVSGTNLHFILLSLTFSNCHSIIRKSFSTPSHPFLHFILDTNNLNHIYEY